MDQANAAPVDDVERETQPEPDLTTQELVERAIRLSEEVRKHLEAKGLLP